MNRHIIKSTALFIFIFTAVGSYSVEKNDALIIKSVKIKINDVITIVNKKRLGEIVKIKLEKEKSHLIWDVEIVKNNQVKDVEIDAISGKILENVVDENDNKEEQQDIDD